LLAAPAVLAAPAGAQAARYKGFTVGDTDRGGPVQGDAMYRNLSYARRYGANVVRTLIVWSRMGDAAYQAQLTRYIRTEARLGVRPILLLYMTGDATQANVAFPPPGPYAQAAATVARLWGQYAAALEVWNEPNGGNEDQAASAYMDVLRPTYQAVKQIAPRLPVLAGAIAFADGKFLEALYAHGLHGVMDGVSYHAYTFNMGPNDQSGGAEYSFKTGGPWLHRIMATNGDADKKLWITEMGWTTDPWKHYRAFYGPTLTKRQIVTDSQRASYMRQAASIMRGWPWLAGAVFYQLRNNHPAASSYHSQRRVSYEWFVDGYALLSRNWQPTASLRTFASLHL
jgi:hypothetical protein